MWNAYRHRFAPLLALAGLLVLTSCGGVLSEDRTIGKPAPPGLFTDATLAEYLAADFAAAKQCAGLELGAFEDLTVVMMEPQFPCRWYANGCSGEFVAPNTVKLGTPYVWKHEVLHYLLYVNTGRTDADHQERVFWDCV